MHSTLGIDLWSVELPKSKQVANKSIAESKTEYKKGNPKQNWYSNRKQIKKNIYWLEYLSNRYTKPSTGLDIYLTGTQNHPLARIFI